MSSFDELSKGLEKKLNNKALSFFVEQLGVSVTKQSVRKFRVGYDKEARAFTSPEFDGSGDVVGVTRRLNLGKGEKKAIHGSKRGLAISHGFLQSTGLRFLRISLSEPAVHVRELLRVGTEFFGDGMPCGRSAIGLES